MGTERDLVGAEQVALRFGGRARLDFWCRLWTEVGHAEIFQTDSSRHHACVIRSRAARDSCARPATSERAQTLAATAAPRALGAVRARTAQQRSRPTHALTLPLTSVITTTLALTHLGPRSSTCLRMPSPSTTPTSMPSAPIPAWPSPAPVSARASPAAKASARAV